LVAYSLPQFGDRDTTTVCFAYTVHNHKRGIIAALIYMPVEEQLPPTMLEQICMYCKQENLPLIVAYDTNAHHPVWGGGDSNCRGKILSEFLAISVLEVAIIGNELTFSVSNVRSIIDVTLVSHTLLQDISNWHV